MKTTLETRPHAAFIFSLCMLAGMAATHVTYSQTEAPQVPAQAAQAQPTMPAVRTLTDTKGRAIEGTILAKSDKAITFQLKGNAKTFKIQLETLSPDDQAFITSLVPAAEKKTTVLFLVDSGLRYDQYSDTLVWLRNNGFDVTIGVCPRLNAEKDDTFDRISKREKAILVSTTKAIDPYDILWLTSFGFDSTEKGAALIKRLGGEGVHLSPNHFELTQHHQNTKKLTVISFGENPKPDIFLEEGLLAKKRAKDGLTKKFKPYFAKSHDDSWVFYNSWEYMDTEKAAIQRRLLEEIKKQLAAQPRPQ